MKRQRTLLLLLVTCILQIHSKTSFGQTCNLSATAIATESKCKATGSIDITPSNGSGTFNFTVTGNSYSSITSSTHIGGLQAGFYSILVRDLVTGCSTQIDSVEVPGTYQDPRFALSVTDISCAGGNDGSISVTNLQYGKPPFSFAIVAPSASGVGSTNSSGIFTGLVAGSYTIQLSDSCGGLQTRIITLVNHNWSVTATTVSKLTCDSANVNLQVTDNNGNTNSSGNPAFNGFVYGYVDAPGDTIWSSSPQFHFYRGHNRSATFVVKDPCGNIVATNWFETQPPSVNASVTISNRLCATFSASVRGQQNLTNPRFCLFDASNVLLNCNNTGSFTNLPYGSYCMNITDTCYDTTIVRCFTVVQPPPLVSSVNISNRTCTDFTATVADSNINNGNFCIYDQSGTLITCNSTGVFNHLPFGSYCINVKNDPACYDTTINTCFTVAQAIPSVNSTVTITSGCGSFSAGISGQQNLTNPQYCLYDNNGVQLTCNSTGQFPGLPWGSYCIHIINDSTCYDTTILRCFTAAPQPVSISVSANPSCTIGTGSARITLSNGVAPYTVNIYDPSGTLVTTINSNTSPVQVNNLPGLPSGQKYKVVVAGGCGSLDSVLFTPRASSLTRTVNLTQKCPGGSSQNGSGDLVISAVFSEGKVTPRLIKRDNTVINIAYSTKTGSNFSFPNLQPGVYVVQYTLENCSNFVYDTVTLAAYNFPLLQQLPAFQCDNNSFTVSAIASGGLPPYSYEVIGSVPAVPSIVQGPQAGNQFTVNNGSSYSVVRLRAVDACGNATINDASIVPLANTIVRASSNCYYNNVDLSVDTFPGAVYTWYKKTSPVDSVLVGSGPVFNLPYLLPSDTGVYVSVVSVNSGCLTRVASYHVTGDCGFTLLAAEGVSFEGKMMRGEAQLKWTAASAAMADAFVVQRSVDGIHFSDIGTVTNAAHLQNVFGFTDASAPFGSLWYRLVLVHSTYKEYSGVLRLFRSGMGRISVLGNPVNNHYTLLFSGIRPGRYEFKLLNADSRLLEKRNEVLQANDSRLFNRNAAFRPGIYYLVIESGTPGDKTTLKLIFR